jgi:hypothetical protein
MVKVKKEEKEWAADKKTQKNTATYMHLTQL